MALDVESAAVTHSTPEYIAQNAGGASPRLRTLPTAEFIPHFFGFTLDLPEMTHEHDENTATLAASLKRLDVLAKEYDAVRTRTVSHRVAHGAVQHTVALEDSRKKLADIDARADTVIDVISRLPIVNNTSVRAKVNGALPDHAYMSPDGYKLQGFLFLLSLKQPSSLSQAHMIARHASRFVKHMDVHDLRRREMEEKIAVFATLYPPEHWVMTHTDAHTRATEQNTKEFVVLTALAGNAHLLATAIPRIDRKLEKAAAFQRKYDREKQKLDELLARPQFIEYTRYVPEMDAHVVERVTRPDLDSDALIIAQKRRSVASLNVWKQRYEKEIADHGWVNTRAGYQQELDSATRQIDTVLARMADKNGRSDEGAVQAVRDMATHTADAAAAPFLIDRMINLLQQRGLYTEIDSVLPDLQDFARRSLTAFLPEGKVVSTRDIKRHVDAMFRYSTLRYIRNVLLTEGKTDLWDAWKAKADAIQPHQITAEMTRHVFDIYRHVGELQHTVGTNALGAIMESPLVANGGILEYTREFLSATLYKTKRPFVGYRNVRPSMLVASLPGLSDAALASLPLGAGGLYDDPRVGLAVAAAKAGVQQSGLHAYINDPSRKRVLPATIAAPIAPNVAVTESLPARSIQHKPISTEDTWTPIMARMKQLIEQDDPAVMELFAKAVDAKHDNSAAVVALLELVLNTLTPEERSVFPSGQYDVARQLAGYFIAHSEEYIRPAKRRNTEGRVVPTYVVVYQNPLTASSSYTNS